MARLDIGDEAMAKRADVQIQPSCEDDFEPALLPVEVALELQHVLRLRRAASAQAALDELAQAQGACCVCVFVFFLPAIWEVL